MSEARTSGGLALPPRQLYPERREVKTGLLEDMAASISAPFIVRSAGRRAKRLGRIVSLAEAASGDLADLDDEALRAAVRDVAIALRHTQAKDAAVIGRSFAVIREMSGRILGRRHYPVQMMGAFALLNGMLAEMATGEGKTLTATLAAGTAALAGMPTHVVTVNDYLAKRDAEEMEPLYAALGLSVGVIVGGMSAGDRRAAYGCDITYCTNKELAFDYLRDRIVLGQSSGNLRLKLEGLAGEDRTQGLRLRGLSFAIVDEADSVLVDEARTPLLISATAESELDEATLARALQLGRDLVPDRDYRLITDERRAVLTPEGREHVESLSESWSGVWKSVVMREELARQAITALFLFTQGEHYLVRDDKVQIIDEHTGRLMPDRFWGEGLHQMVELKEGCALSGRRLTIARMTYQRLFRRYRLLSGMSGTVREVSDEMWTVYRLPVVRIPTNRPSQRLRLVDRVLPTEEAKWTTLIERVSELHGRGLPVLIGTRSVASSERASSRLTEAGLPHVVLNAAQDKVEAEIVASAGARGRIMVATNMAGRGTDIKLAPGVAALGGLQVIMAERFDSSRVDGQLAGRAGRQGEPGSFQAILSMDDPLLDIDRSGLLRRLGRPAMALFGERAGRFILRFAQWSTERLHSRMRRDLLAADRKLLLTLAFSGKSE